ncbi:MAG: response regulator [Nitrospirae bacterium]|nr:response regulator [Nitrospirota bacterium]
MATTRGATAINKAIKFIPDLVLLNDEMQTLKGLDVLKELRSYSEFKDTPVIMLSRSADKSNIINSIKSGANDYVVTPFDIGVLFAKIIGWQNSEMETQWHGLSHEQAKILRLLKVMIEEAFENVRKSTPLSASLIRYACEILYLTIESEGADAILKAVEGYNTTMFLHSLLTCVYMMLFTRYKRYAKDSCIELAMGGLLHDIGSAKIPNNILFKPGKLDINEYIEIKAHVQYGIEIMDKTPDLPQVVKDICLYHHERLDGSGYYGIKAEKISTGGRLAAIIETYCAITTKTVYRQPKTTAEAIATLMSLQDQLDPKLLEDFKEAATNNFKVNNVKVKQP